MTTSQIEAENTQMTNDLYRLLKKYTGLRNLIRELKVKYISVEAENTLVAFSDSYSRKCYLFVCLIFMFVMVFFIFPVRIWQHEDVPNVPPVHNAQRHDQGHHAWPWLHGSVPRGGSIARGAQLVEALLHRPQTVRSSLASGNNWNGLVCSGTFENGWNGMERNIRVATDWYLAISDFRALRSIIACK